LEARLQGGVGFRGVDLSSDAAVIA